MNALAQIHIDRAAKARRLDEARNPLRDYVRGLPDNMIGELMFVCVEAINGRLPDDVHIEDAVDAVNDEITAFVNAANHGLIEARYMDVF